MNGYTSALAEGEETFSSFVWRCAQAFVGDPERVRDLEHELEETHEELVRARNRLYDDKARSVDEWVRLREESSRTVAEFVKESNARMEIIRSRYEGMLRQVEVWTPSEECLELRRFMCDQLRESIKFDCRRNDYLDSGGPDMEAPIEEYIADRIQHSAREVTYHEERFGKLSARMKNRLTFIWALEEAVPRERRKVPR